MDKAYTLRKENLLDSFRAFLKSLLGSGEVSGVLVPLRSVNNQAIMPALVSDLSLLDQADPLSPSFQLNGAKLVSRLTRREGEEKIAAVLRPCEVRAFVELVKIHQARWDNIVIISHDCAGAFSNRDFNQLAKDKGEGFTLEFIKKKIADNFDMESPNISTACQICDKPFPELSDITLHYFGAENQELVIVSQSEKGAGILGKIAGDTFKDAGSSSDILQKTMDDKNICISKRKEKQKAIFEQLAAQTSSIAELSNYFSSCVNCYNCRVACPVCFCKECVFNTDVVDYDPFQYSAWSKARGVLKMPVDTVFFHMTRMIHMGLSCVGCGQCSNACPNDIPIAELFKMAGLQAQKAFDYVPGKDVADAPPLSVFYENEFKDVTGLH
ncbi:FdhB6 [Desulfamplus magnetovallimortis]|uniref:FdhB6 n=1 Tax=Desulfamplus magnetovallimortis TaxID=1246637 RepID=A0A1W1H6H0_9BACT|nr:Coenzyme F420 hydrogenase/dehydrogenase, beta subunit C-terminal domain [Desulfamplus magnetovallimortis]SLM28063.1 FdhB6 [Desulfamplus magnetovallimortis]